MLAFIERKAPSGFAPLSLLDLHRRADSSRRARSDLRPQSLASRPGERVRPEAGSFRQLLQPPDISPSEHHLVHDEGLAEQRDHVRDELAPAALTVLLQAAQTEVVLELALLVV